MADALRPDHLDDSLLVLKRRYEAEAKAASEQAEQAERAVLFAQQRLGQARDALRAANERLGGLIVHLNDTYALMGDRITPDGTIERAEARRAAVAYSDDERAVMDGRVRRVIEGQGGNPGA